MKLLLVEDDETIAMGLRYSLEKEGYDLTHCRTYADACAAWEKDTYDLCLLDINLPDGSGYDICRRFRSTSDAPVIFLTAADAEVNVVMGLELGADDYICKPFRIHELMARIRAVMRRSGKEKPAASGVIAADRVRISTNEAKVSVIGEDGSETPVELTALEYRLLLAFCSNRGIVLSRSALLQELWDVSGDFVNDNTLTVYIKRLRDKIERDPADPKIIKTVRGLGYKMEP